MFKRFIEGFEYAARARTLNILQGVSRERLIAAGISPELLAQGIDAWPWRIETSDAAELTAVSTSLKTAAVASIQDNHANNADVEKECEFDAAA